MIGKGLSLMPAAASPPGQPSVPAELAELLSQNTLCTLKHSQRACNPPLANSPSRVWRCACAQVCVMQPTVGIKNALQEGRPIPRSPAVLYRGLGVRPSPQTPAHHACRERMELAVPQAPTEVPPPGCSHLPRRWWWRLRLTPGADQQQPSAAPPPGTAQERSTWLRSSACNLTRAAAS